MAYSVNSCFKRFIDDSVNLCPNRTALARQSRDWLILQLRNLSSMGKIPPLYDEVSPMFYGSFARKTKVRPLDDIDLIIAFNAQGCTANSVEKNFRFPYQVYLNENSIKLPQYGDNGILNSRKLIEGIKLQLMDISNYQKAEIHRNQEAVTLKLSSYEWNFDIVPAFYTTTGFYMIPDGQGSWKGTDPRIDQSRITSANKKHNGELLPLIRLMKYWKNIYWGKSVSSYLFENLMISWADSIVYFPTNYSEIILNALEYLRLNIMQDYEDPKRFQGNINDLDFNERFRLSSIANSCESKVYEAMKLESNGEVIFAINKWIEIFGHQFPAYGK